MRGAEAVQNLLRIVRDDRDIYSPLFEASARLLQLDELASAVGSPIGASTKDQKKSCATTEIAKLSFVAVLIHQCEVRYFLPDLKTGGCAIVLGLNEILKLARCDLLATAHFFQDLCENLAVPRNSSLASLPPGQRPTGFCRKFPRSPNRWPRL